MNNIEKIRQEIERQLEYFKGKEDDAWDDCDNYTDEDASWYQGHWKMCSKLLSFIDSLPEEKPIEKDENMETLIACDIMEATVKRVNIDKQDKDKEEEAMLEKINYLRNLGLNE